MTAMPCGIPNHLFALASMCGSLDRRLREQDRALQRRSGSAMPR
jgi:hypothetical protein